jgi:hypothetical protein
MKADLTRLTFQADKHYRSVRMQQGRVQLDADWNEQHDIVQHRIETETLDTLGQAAAPLANPGFALKAAGKNIAIGAGRLYVEGLLCENAAQVNMTAQPDFPPSASPILPAGATLIPLPPAGSVKQVNIVVYDAAGQAVDPPDGIYLAYLEAWQRHLTALDDPLIREVALGGPDSSTREQTLWQVRLLRADALGASLSCLSTVAAWDALVAAPDGVMGARALPTAPPTGPCELPPDAGYRGLENQLYRVEIHDDGSIGPLRYKWSRNNGFLETRVLNWLNNPVADEFEVASIGRDAYLAIGAGCWLEFFDDTHELLGQSGTLVKVLKTAANVVTLDLTSATGSLDQALFTANPRVRVWDNWAQMTPVAPGTGGGWAALESGIEVKFAPGRYRVGDYWTIPARTASAGIEWPADSGGTPRFLSPQGVLRVFTRLALASVSAGNWTMLSDCRQLFPGLSQLTNLYYVGGDGQEIVPDLVNAVNNVLPGPLEVAVFNGQFPVEQAQVRFSASHGTLPNGSTVQEVATVGGIAAIDWTLDPTVLNQRVSAQLLEGGQAAVGKYNSVHFSARLSLASQVGYDPAKCPELAAQKVANVQDALDALCLLSHKGGGCCVTVGKEGSFPTLDVALLALAERGERDVCICLLPGEHRLESGIKLEAPGMRVEIHGAGRATRLMLDGRSMAFVGLAALSLHDFDMFNAGDPTSLQVDGVPEVQFHNLHVGGRNKPGDSLVQLTQAREITMAGCRLRSYQPESMEVFERVFSRIELLKPLRASFELEHGEIFLPVAADVATEFFNYDEATRRACINSIALFIRAGDEGQPPLNEVKLAMGPLVQALGNRSPASTVGVALERLRSAMMLSLPGFALQLGDPMATTLLADSQVHGRLSFNGESFSDASIEPNALGTLQGRLETGQATLSGTEGSLRLRNNLLREMRFGDKWFAQTLEAGRVIECYGSVVADANTLVGPLTQMMAIHVAWSSNVLRPFSDVGTVFSRQAKYIGNFADNDFRLWNVGGGEEKFGNGALNII